MDLYAIGLVVMVLLVTDTWTAVTLFTGPKTFDKYLVDFYRRLKIPGPGWKTVRLLTDTRSEKAELATGFTGWISCCVFIYSLTLGIGKLLLHQFFAGLMCIILTVISGLVLSKVLAKMKIFDSADDSGR